MRVRVLPPILITLLAYHAIVRNYFFADDFFWLYELANHGWWPTLVEAPPGHLYLARNLVMGLTWIAAGPEPGAWYASTLLLHAVNVLLVYALLVSLTDRAGLASALATLWGVSRAHENTIGWYGAFGHELAAAALLLVGLDLSGVSRRGAPVSLAVALRWVALLAVAGTSFGVGLVAAAVFPLLLRLAVDRGNVDRRAYVALGALALGLAVLYVVQHAWWPLARGGAIGTGTMAPMEAIEAPGAITAFAGHLLGAGLAQLLLGPLAPLVARPGPIAAAAAGTGLLVLAAGFAGADGERRRLLVVLVLLAVLSYTAIALGRARFYVSIGGALAAAASTGRYHYTGEIWLAAALGVALSAGMDRLGVVDPLRRAATAAFLGGLVVVLLLRPYLLDHHAWERAQTVAARRVIADARAAAVGPGPVVIANRPFGPIWPVLLFEPPWAFPGLAGAYLALGWDGDGPVRFVAQNAEEYAAVARGGRIAAMLLPP